MRDNTVKRRLAEGGTAIGTYVMEFFTTGLCRIVANAGADFAIFDMEHGGWATGMTFTPSRWDRVTAGFDRVVDVVGAVVPHALANGLALVGAGSSCKYLSAIGLIPTGPLVAGINPAYA